MASMLEDEMLMMLSVFSGLLEGIPMVLLRIASYVFSSLAIYTVAQRRGLRKPWLAWVPVVNVWLLGSLSDQYQYVVKRENKAKRKWLLALSAVMCVLTAVIVVMVVSIVGTAFFGSYRSGTMVISRIMRPLLSILGLCLPLAGVGIAYTVIRYMALYDVYRSMDPENCVLFLVLSVLFRVPEPFFLFFNRNKDKGMPPRRPAPAYDQKPENQECL